ncbi:MAG: acyl-ACP--UDP-N-acetylglucosamine O-acyltransferase [Alphaproteobacteria bacterium]|nr:acyl-ACP--UDP-N-acetylglucosamine O-acyltransferase [Alphaproteobacteria bacterium]MCZ6765180.1 acyl-ACP--UDP-N-acetylglucosamine O-acyltransferase [Alphaproteobacteria bacterium]
MPEIHPTAIVGDDVVLGDGVAVGPYSVISGDVEIGSGTAVHSHVVIGGRTRIGPDCEIYPFASIGLPPQDTKYRGEKSELSVGARCRIREYVTMNPGTEGGGMLTIVGDDCLFMVGAHVAHDCRVGSNVILANNATLGGHVEIGDFAIIGGVSAIHQFVKIGAHAIVGGMSGVRQNVIPYGSAMGERAWLTGLNLVGMKRRDMAREEINAVRDAYRILFSEEGMLTERVQKVVGKYENVGPIVSIIDFIQQETSRAVLQPKSENGVSDS